MITPGQMSPPSGRHGSAVDRAHRWMERSSRALPWWPIGLAVVVGLGAVLLVAEVWESIASEGTVARLDRHLFSWFLDHRVGWLVSLSRLVTWLGDARVDAILVGLVVAVLATRRRYREAVLLAAVFSGTVILAAATKALTVRTRPALAHQTVAAVGSAFPSAHAAQALATFAALALVVTMLTPSRLLRAVAWGAAVIISLAVGLSRVYLGVHWPSDVCIGWLLAGTWLIMCSLVALQWRKPRGPAQRL